jgi:hypothetical protein
VRCATVLLLPWLAAAAWAQPASVTFDGERYAKRFDNRTAAGRVVEYTREGESLADWTRLVAVRHFPQQSDPRAAAAQLAQTVRQHNPQARAEVIARPDGSEAIVDFLTWAPGDDRLEFNVHRYRREPGTPGLVAWQFAWRFRSAELADPTATVRAHRKRFVDAMANAQWPSAFARPLTPGPAPR